MKKASEAGSNKGSASNATVVPPFQPKQKVICVRLSKDRKLNGRIIDMCRCTKGSEYIVEGCVWHYKFGWLVSITGELHAASDFRSAQMPQSTRREE